MAEVAPVPAAASPTKVLAKQRRRRTGPTVSELIVSAVSDSRERKGMSLAALKKALAAQGYDVNRNKARIRISVKSLVGKGWLLRTRGKGASGSFKVDRKALAKRARRPARRRRRAAGRKRRRVGRRRRRRVARPKRRAAGRRRRRAAPKRRRRSVRRRTRAVRRTRRVRRRSAPRRVRRRTVRRRSRVRRR